MIGAVSTADPNAERAGCRLMRVMTIALMLLAHDPESVQRFSLATDAKRVRAEIMREQIKLERGGDST